MVNLFKLGIQTLLNPLGLEVKRIQKKNHPLLPWLESHGINIYIDVGAHDGSHAERLFKEGYTGTVISVEPIPESHRKLVERIKKHKKHVSLPIEIGNWLAYTRCVLGAEEGTATFNVSNNLQSSSILDMLAVHEESAPESKVSYSMSVPMRTLDQVTASYRGRSYKMFVKLDVQGYELEVLKGGMETLEEAIGLQVEVSITELYKGAPSRGEMLKYLQNNGFELYDERPVYRHAKTNQLMQVDMLVFRKEKTTEGVLTQI